jgi:hypothetical protein
MLRVLRMACCAGVRGSGIASRPLVVRAPLVAEPGEGFEDVLAGGAGGALFGEESLDGARRCDGRSSLGFDESVHE